MGGIRIAGVRISAGFCTFEMILGICCLPICFYIFRLDCLFSIDTERYLVEEV